MGTKIKISVIIDISILQFYGYIKNITVNILIQNINESKIDQKL